MYQTDVSDRTEGIRRAGASDGRRYQTASSIRTRSIKRAGVSHVRLRSCQTHEGIRREEVANARKYESGGNLKPQTSNLVGGFRRFSHRRLPGVRNARHVILTEAGPTTKEHAALHRRAFSCPSACCPNAFAMTGQALPGAPCATGTRYGPRGLRGISTSRLRATAMTACPFAGSVPLRHSIHVDRAAGRVQHAVKPVQDTPPFRRRLTLRPCPWETFQTPPGSPGVQEFFRSGSLSLPWDCTRKRGK